MITPEMVEEAAKSEITHLNYLPNIIGGPKKSISYREFMENPARLKNCKNYSFLIVPAEYFPCYTDDTGRFRKEEDFDRGFLRYGEKWRTDNKTFKVFPFLKIQELNEARKKGQISSTVIKGFKKYMFNDGQHLELNTNCSTIDLEQMAKAAELKDPEVDKKIVGVLNHDNFMSYLFRFWETATACMPKDKLNKDDPNYETYMENLEKINDGYIELIKTAYYTDLNIPLDIHECYKDIEDRFKIEPNKWAKTRSVEDFVKEHSQDPEKFQNMQFEIQSIIYYELISQKENYSQAEAGGREL